MMRHGKLSRFAAGILVGGMLAVGGVLSAQPNIDDDFMRSVEDASNTLNDDLATGNAKGVAREADALAGMFAQVEAYYAQKGDAADAVDLSRKSRELSSEIAKRVSVRDMEGATMRANDLTRACKACHSFYKQG